MYLPLDVDVINYGPPSYVNVCSDAFRDWLTADEETWFTRRMATWYDEQYLHIAWDSKVHVPGMIPYEGYSDGEVMDEHLGLAMQAVANGDIPEVKTLE